MNREFIRRSIHKLTRVFNFENDLHLADKSRYVSCICFLIKETSFKVSLNKILMEKAKQKDSNEKYMLLKSDVSHNNI